MPLLACHPRDLLRQLSDLARYDDRAPELSSRTLDWAWDNYFAAAAPSGRSMQLDRRERGKLETQQCEIREPS